MLKPKLKTFNNNNRAGAVTPAESEEDMEGYTIRCGSHIYITLEWNDKFIHCYDNDMMYAEDIILAVEKRTGMNFEDIPIKGNKEDFRGIRFFNGGWIRNFWDNFPSRNELDGYKKMKYGR